MPITLIGRLYHLTKNKQLTSKIHMLAPLLDRMTTRDLQKRFTAAEALYFFGTMMSELTETQLQQPHYEQNMYTYDQYDRWKDPPFQLCREMGCLQRTSHSLDSARLTADL